MIRKVGRFAMTPSGVVGNFVVPFLAVFTALVLGGLVMVFSDSEVLHAWGNFFSDPWAAISDSWDLVYGAYKALFQSSLGSKDAIADTINRSTPLILAGLSVALAFQAGLFNIGGEGQILAGTLCAGYVGFTYDLPAAIHLPLALIAGAVGGAIWAGIAGVLKARTGAHEVITTIMLNFIALRLTDYLLSTSAFQREGRNDPISEPVHHSAELPGILGSNIHAGILVALAAAVAMAWLFRSSTTGFRLKTVGSNTAASRYAGINVGMAWILAMLLAGGLTGMAGATQLLGTQKFIRSGFSGIGFDAIALALLGRTKPFGVVLAGLLFGILRSGAVGMQAQTDVPVDIIVVVQALIVVFVAAPALIREIYHVKVPEKTGIEQLATGWG